MLLHRINICLIFCLLTFHLSAANISGTITDKTTNLPLTGVAFYIAELKAGTVSDINGRYRLENLPPTLLTMQVSFIGYRTLAISVNLAEINEFNIELEPVATEVGEVVVTGLSGTTEKQRLPIPVSIITKSDLLQTSSTNIIDALSKQPGVSQISTGSGISKPVIRGLGYNRVIVVHNGIRQEGNQWGDEHGVEIDEYSVTRAEIIKGPASLVYGSDALAGVINLVSENMVNPNEISGDLLLNYQTNNGLIGTAANIAGNTNSIKWNLNLSQKSAHSYQNPYDGYVYNSGFREYALSAKFGISKSWGYSFLAFGLYKLKPGLPEGERDSASGKFNKPVFINDSTIEERIVSDTELKSYQPQAPWQNIDHYSVNWSNSFYFGGNNLKTNIGYQQNHRQEFEEIDPGASYGLYFLLKTLTYDFKYNPKEVGGFAFTGGINGMFQNSENKGSEYLIPEYSLFDAGTFVLVKKNYNAVDLSGGFRYDKRIQQISSLFVDISGENKENPETDTILRFKNSDEQFEGFSGGLGLSWKINNWLYSKINISKGYRAPNIAELASNGEHEGTFRYETGNRNLKPEQSLQLDITAGMTLEHFSTEINLFENSINYFIYQHKLNSVNGGDSLIADLPVFSNTQGNAAMRGGEFALDFHPHPLDWIHLETSFSYVQGKIKNQPDSLKYLPYIPAPKWQTAIQFNIKLNKRFLANNFIKFETEYHFKQDKIFSAYDTETETPAYLLLNLGLGTNFVKQGQTIALIYFMVNNLTDVGYQDHLSRLKYAPENYANGKTGIYNMGRNLSFKLIVPFGTVKS